MKLTNNILSVEVAEHGAELISLKKDDREYMWSGDPAFWNRHAPILFPAVGKPFENTIRVDSKTYPMKQHGFARDSEYETCGDCSEMNTCEKLGMITGNNKEALCRLNRSRNN